MSIKLGKTQGKKTDTAIGELQAKIDLRLRFLNRYHLQDSRVFDACQGEGSIWREVRRHFPVTSYWAMDKKPKRGRIRMDSAKVLAAGVSDNVIDVDTYGLPFDHWLNVLPNITQPTTVFLTIGISATGVMSNRVASLIGLGGLKLPNSLYGKLWPHALQVLYSQPTRFGLRIVEAVGLQPTQNVRYAGFHLIPEAKQKE